MIYLKKIYKINPNLKNIDLRWNFKEYGENISIIYNIFQDLYNFQKLESLIILSTIHRNVFNKIILSTNWEIFKNLKSLQLHYAPHDMIPISSFEIYLILNKLPHLETCSLNLTIKVENDFTWDVKNNKIINLDLSDSNFVIPYTDILRLHLHMFNEKLDSFLKIYKNLIVLELGKNSSYNIFSELLPQITRNISPHLRLYSVGESGDILSYSLKNNSNIFNNLEFLEFLDIDNINLKYVTLLPKLKYLNMRSLNIINLNNEIMLDISKIKPNLLFNYDETYYYENDNVDEVYLENKLKILQQTFNLSDFIICGEYSEYCLMKPHFTKKQWLKDNGFYMAEICGDKLVTNN
jgi:hypothetical protein